MVQEKFVGQLGSAQVMAFFTQSKTTAKLQETVPTKSNQESLQQTDEVPDCHHEVSKCCIFSLITFNQEGEIFPEVIRTVGRIKSFINSWENILPMILKFLIISETAKIDFDSYPSSNNFSAQESHFSETEPSVVDEEISKLLSKGATEPSSHEEGEVISPIFIRPKRDGSMRTIINLKFLNEFIAYKHFKLESLTDVINLMSRDCFFAKIDLKDAYFSVSIALEHRKYLKFLWRGVLYQFTCLRFGLSCAPGFFTKLLKPVVAILRVMVTLLQFILMTY